jgi:hypothetical protein
MAVTRFERLFAALILAQAAHSVEEYAGALYESFPPARFLSGLISDDRQIGFLIANLVLVAAGIWCALVPIGHGWRRARAVAAVWVGTEILNGIGHPLWSLIQGGYTPGVATAPLLLILALLVGRELARSGADPRQHRSSSLLR